MNFLSRRTIRKYKQKKIEQKVIRELMESVLSAPSGRNYKPCEFILVDDEETIKKLSQSGAFFNDDAPLIIVTLWNSNLSPTGEDDSCIASTFIHLKAHNLGLGSCWIQTKNMLDKNGRSCNENIKEILNIPSNLNVNNMISLGYPDEIKPSYTKEDLDINKLHFNKW
ncbi:nitroreductase family protein [Fusobacterium sp.]|uniref:nitroreductase family protein n=1 Tax=Fusobacterium sp. TaxID=68766 RepID=UPI0026067666|nr:nitroreductase family protein [Fusobacterium sp.]